MVRCDDAWEVTNG
uniref:Uncharacterized protein n=1 Tax=Arundo donax TaxID=35708 RepID=A0A0A8XQ93_ARUDO